MNMDVQPKTRAEEIKDFDLESKILDQAYGFLDASSKKYKKEYHEFPEELKSNIFSNKSIEVLKNYSTEVRLVILSKAINNFLSNPPCESNKYFSTFPLDREIVKKISDVLSRPNHFPEKSGDISIATLGMWDKYSVTSPKKTSLSDDRGYDYWLKADKLNRAQDLILLNGDMNDDFLLDYGEIGQKIIDKIEIAEDILNMRGESISVDDLFGDEFDKLPNKDKKNLLIKLLSYLHNIQIFDEVWNSDTSEDSVKKESDELSKLGSKHFGSHSMIYKSHHHNSIYEQKDKKYFEYIINQPFSDGPLLDYGFIKLIEETINKIGEQKEDVKELIDFIIEFWDKNRNPIFGEYVSDILSKLDPNYASKKLLEAVSKEKNDKNHLASILYRLEFGKIGISNEGVQYLERMYDLGEYNNENYSVERLTPKGEIGIFNEEEKLIKYFELGDVTNENKNIKAEVLDFIYETLFLPKSNETVEEREQRLEYLNEFKDKYHKLSQDKIFKETGVYLNNLTFKEQGSFIFYLNDINKKENKDNENLKKEELTNFVKNYKEAGMRTFLSIQQGGFDGKQIVAFGEELSRKNLKELASFLFAKYGEYIDAVNSVEEVVNKEYKFAPSPDLINKTKESLLIRGRDLLLAQNQKLLDGEFREEKFIESLDNTKVGVDLFKNIFRIVKENNPDTSFEDFAGLVPDQIKSRDQIKDEDVLNIDKIIDKNYLNEELRNAVKESFHKAIESGSTILNLLRRDGDIVALDRIDKKEDGTLYFGSFNVDPDYCSSKIGAAFFEATVLPLMKNNIIKADCSSLQPIASYYIEAGFVADHSYDYNGEPSFSLESMPNKKFISKDLSKSQIIELSIKNENTEGLIIKSYSSQNEIAENKIIENHILSRYFFDKNTNKWFVVLEKIN